MNPVATGEINRGVYRINGGLNFRAIIQPTTKRPDFGYVENWHLLLSMGFITTTPVANGRSCGNVGGMRNTTISIVALFLFTASALAQPAPFPETIPLEITYPNFPAASGMYVFTFDEDHYLHSMMPTTFGTLEWSGPFTPQGSEGEFVHAAEGTLVRFDGVFLNDGSYRVNAVHHPTITVTGPGNVPEPAMLGLGALGLLAQRRRARMI